MVFVFMLTFLRDAGAVSGWMSTLFTQSSSESDGSTTICPHISPFFDYSKAIENPTIEDMHRYFQVGKIAAYRSLAFIKLRQKRKRALEDCLEKLNKKHSQDKPIVTKEMSSRRHPGRASLAMKIKT
mmetsp:Transcript_367/g.473  ORF Transcript_367/g.473 Transcript_367/m.473 type:complete len:127 (-) Transcript_367:63-443(-)